MLTAGVFRCERVFGVAFEPTQTLQGGIGFTTYLAFGPEDPDPTSSADGCIYACPGANGTIHRICFDGDKSVTSHTIVVDLNGAGSVEALLGITFEPGREPGWRHVLCDE